MHDRAFAGLMAGELNALVPYLRSFQDPVLSMAADMIDGTAAEPRIVMDVPKSLRTQRKHDRIGAFVGARVENGMPLKAAVHDAEKHFGVSRSTVLAAWSDYKKFMQGIEAKVTAYLEKVTDAPK